jgi:S-adenosylmethionine:tRNA-ribosyltransferase-isomerase (queuine synthetase)
MKKLFANYNFEFDKNEKKLLTNFSKQALKQMSGDSKFFAEEKAFNSIIEKLNHGNDVVKFTKDEKTRLTHQLKQNSEFMKKEMKKSWFIKKWLYKSIYKQYDSLIEKHFKD